MVAPDSASSVDASSRAAVNHSTHWLSAARVAIAYLVAGMLWIILSDLMLASSSHVNSVVFWVSVSKGFFFVIVSASFVFWLCQREYRQLQRATDLLRAVVDGTSDSVFVKDIHGRYLLVNAAGLRIIDRPLKEVIGKDDRELFDAPDAEHLMENDRTIMTCGKVVTFEERLTLDGAARVYQATKAPYFDGRGEVVGMIGIGRDVTERRQVELALRETDARLREAQRIARLGSWSWEPQNDFVWWSDAEFELLGVNPDTTRPSFQAFLASLHPDDRAEAVARVDAMLAGANEFANDLRVVRPDGSCIWIHSQARATRDADGAILRVEGIDQDITAQRLSQDEVLESEQRLQAAVEVAGIGIIVIDYDQQVAELSERAAEQFGFPAKATVSRDELHARFHASDRGWLDELIKNVHDPASTGWFDTEHRVTRPDGTSRWLNVRKRVTFKEGKAQRAVVVTVDVTDQKMAKVRLQEQEMLVREAAELAKVGGWGFDPETHQSDWTPAVAQMYGLSFEACPQVEKALDFFCAEHRTLLMSSLETAVRDGLPHDLELKLTAADGVTRWVRSICRPIVENGKTVRVRGSLQDITDRKRAEAELQASERRLRLALEAAGAAAFVWDIPNDKVIRYYSTEPALPVTAGKPEVLDDVRAKVHPDDLADFDARLAECLASGTDYRNEYRVIRDDGTSASVEDYGFLDRASDGSPLTLTGLVLDVTERRQLEEQFRQAQKMEAVGRLAGGVAHDFNNLLTVINGYSELVLDDLTPDDPARGPLSAIHDAGDRAARLTEQLLAFSRKSMIEPRLIDLNELVVHSSKLLHRLIGEDIALEVLTAPKRIQVVFDPGQLEQVLMNLAINARDAMPTGGCLTIETSLMELSSTRDRLPLDLPAGQFACLRVTDTGCGMSSDVMQKIFEPFFTTKGVGKGTGLGLAVVHGVVRQSGGAVTVESTVGEGTSFHILLPAVTDACLDEQLTELVVAPRGNETILVVEDEGAVRTLIRMVLEEQGYTVLSASGGNQARELLLSNDGKVDLLLTDVIMPEISGRELAFSFRELRPELQVLFMSGYTDDALDRHGLHGSTEHFIQKPFSPLKLARRVRELLDLTKN